MDSRPETYAHIGLVRSFLSRVIGRLLVRQIEHDQSKLVSPEVEIFDEFTPKLKGSTYGTAEYREFLTAMTPALNHHYKTYRHHPEHFALVDDQIDYEEVLSGNAFRKMSLIDIIEMLCDWKAASMRHDDGDIRKSIEINQKRHGYSDEMKQIMLNTLDDIESVCSIP